MGGQYPKFMCHTSHICTVFDRSCWIKHNTTLRRPQDLVSEAGYHNTSFTLHSKFDAPDPLWRRWVTNTPNACTSSPTSALVLISLYSLPSLLDSLPCFRFRFFLCFFLPEDAAPSSSCCLLFCFLLMYSLTSSSQLASSSQLKANHDRHPPSLPSLPLPLPPSHLFHFKIMWWEQSVSLDIDKYLLEHKDLLDLQILRAMYDVYHGHDV